MRGNTGEKYGLIARGLHWLMAFLILGLLAVGFGMTKMPASPLKFEVYGFHKSFGMLALMLVGFRILWKGMNAAPAHLNTHARWEILLARTVHVLLYAGMIGMPLSGWVMSAAGEFAVPFFGLFDIPPVVPKNEQVFEISRAAHEFTAFALIAGIGLHFLGAAKHHWIDRDATLRRMGGNTLILLAAGLLLGFVSFLAAAEIASKLIYREKNAGAPEAAAAETAEERPAAAPALPDAWTIQPADTKIGFTFTQYGKAVTGHFSSYEGRIHFDPDRPEAGLADITIDVASIDTGSADRDDQALSADWFDAGQYPAIRFTARAFTRNGPQTYVAHGVLRVRDTEKPLDLPFTLDIREMDDGRQARLQARIILNRLDYGVGQGQWASGQAVGEAVEISIDLAATQ